MSFRIWIYEVDLNDAVVNIRQNLQKNRQENLETWNLSVSTHNAQLLDYFRHVDLKDDVFVVTVDDAVLYVLEYREDGRALVVSLPERGAEQNCQIRG